jgi:tRNA nucleotidyltransferase (CCA-adding enzyme)
LDELLERTHLFTDIARLQGLDASVLSPQTWPFSLDWLPRAAYLVGGNVRDALLGRRADYLDLDFVLPEGAVKIARAIASYYQAGFVLLDAERHIARVVFEKATVDFAQQVGGSLEEDLRRRDFTVNAIAYSPHTQEVLDPLQGAIALRQGLIQMVAPENLKEDPLRLLRAYRQAAQLGFTLEPETQKTIHQLAGLIQEIAAERVQGEIGYLLSTEKGTPFLAMAWQDGLLKHWFPGTTAAGLQQLAAVDRAAIALSCTWAVKGFDLSGWLRDQQKTSGTGRSWLKIAKLVCLISPDLATAEQELWHLKYSRAEIQTALSVMQWLSKTAVSGLSELSLREQFLMFRGVGAAFPALAVLTVALNTSMAAIAPLIERFLDPTDPVAHPVPALTGRDLMTQLKLPAGPQIGQLLEAIQLAKAEGKIQTREQALEFAQTLSAGLPVSDPGRGTSGKL